MRRMLTSNTPSHMRSMTHIAWVMRWNCRLGFGRRNTSSKRQGLRFCVLPMCSKSLGLRRSWRGAEKSSMVLKWEWEGWPPLESNFSIYYLMVSSWKPCHILHPLTPYSQHRVPGVISDVPLHDCLGNVHMGLPTITATWYLYRDVLYHIGRPAVPTHYSVFIVPLFTICRDLYSLFSDSPFHVIFIMVVHRRHYSLCHPFQ